MNLIEEFKKDTIENVLNKHNLTLDEAFNICLHKEGQMKEVPEEKFLYVQKYRDYYRIRKSVKGKLITFGYYKTLEDAIIVRDALIDDGWRLYRLSKICKELNIELVK